ncbi:helix-turn-helix domain-containing protein [Lactococcus petauri]
MQERKKAFNPKQLTSARLARGLTMKELAEKADISRQMISNYESGKTTPKAENLLKIISVLQFPHNFFMQDMSPLYSGATYFRSQSAATKKVRDMQAERLKYFSNVYENLSLYVNFPPTVLPTLLEKDIHEITEEDIIHKAKELREVWEIDDSSPIGNLVNIAESKGILIAEANMEDDKLDAVSRWIKDRPFIMLTNNNESSVRRRFNVAHELGHIILHNTIESIHDYSSKDLKNLIEKQAHSFASHFLLPDKAFSDSLLSTSMEYYIELKKYWKVSIASMIYKTFSMKLINEDQYLYLNKKLSWNKWRKIEPLDDTISIEKPELFSKVYNVIVDHDILPKKELNRSLNLPIDETKKIIGSVVMIEEQDIPNEPILRLVK